EQGIRTEPYFDFPLDDMLYLSDTGRRWAGTEVSIRDRFYNRNESYYSGWARKPVTGSAMMMTEKGIKFQSEYRPTKTRKIISAAEKDNLPDRIFLTIHPQRWSDGIMDWAKELIQQNIKNQVKYVINKIDGGK
ncbi:MAG: hypothetical protein JXN62_07375, partial [Bacteroidales bacterium]|nr:hypothetical protein [Bacteroidales bacterium]